MYHQGELEAQAITGESNTGERNGRIITNNVIPGAVNFIEKQPFFIASSLNQKGEIVASVIAGDGGFVKILDESSLQVDRSLINSSPYDPLWSNIVSGSKLGMLFIEPSSRRRFRVNGEVQTSGDQVIISIDQAYPNCPKYIQQRHVLRTEKLAYQELPESSFSLTACLIDMILKADTFFVGSANEAGDLDASHRGGSPGFITVEADGSLLIPDYPGNSMYNTFGNFIQNPKAGLLFIDFENHKTLQLTGTAQIIWNANDAGSRTGGTGRYWKFFVENCLLMENLKGYEWNFIAYSPLNPIV